MSSRGSRDDVFPTVDQIGKLKKQFLDSGNECKDDKQGSLEAFVKLMTLW